MTRHPYPARQRRHRLIPAAFLAATLLLTACGAGGPDAASRDAASGAGEFPMTVENCGRELTFDSPPQRVVTIGAEAPTLVAAAGAADRIVAMGGSIDPEFFGDYRDDLADVPQLGVAADELSTEVLIAQQPDLIISINSDNFDALEPAGIQGLVIGGRCRGADDENTSTGSFEEVYADIELYGRLLGTPDVAAAAGTELAERVAAVEEQFASTTARPAATVIYGSSGDQLGSYGGASVAHSQMTALGLTNVFEELPERFFEPSIEEIIDRDPQVLVLLFEVPEGTDAMSLAKLRASPEFAAITAIRNDDIITLPFALAGSSPGAVAGLEQLAEQLAALDAP